jgi:hypothetical protein
MIWPRSVRQRVMLALKPAPDARARVGLIARPRRKGPRRRNRTPALDWRTMSLLISTLERRTGVFAVHAFRDVRIQGLPVKSRQAGLAKMSLAGLEIR